MSRFDQVAHEWDRKDIRVSIGKHCSEAIRRNIELHGDMRVMDFGAGTGFLTFSVAPAVKEVVAVDTSEKMLEVLRSKNSEGLPITTYHGDIMHMPIADDFDLIISSMAMHHVEDSALFFKTLAEHLKPGGMVGICDLEQEDGTFHSHGNEGVFHFGFDQEKLKEIAQDSGFHSIAFDEVMVIEKESGSYPIFMMSAVRQ